MVLKRLGVALAIAGILPTPINGQAAAPADEGLCNSKPPSLPEALKLSDRVVLYIVTKVVVDADPSPADDMELVRGRFELSPLATLKGSGSGERTSVRFDATLYADLFGGSPCRWSPLPGTGEIWIATGDRDGEDCAECDGRLDAFHKLGWLGPINTFLNQPLNVRNGS